MLIELALDAADGAGMSWLHRHTEVIDKTFDAEGRVAMTVRVRRTKRKRCGRSLHRSDIRLPRSAGEMYMIVEGIAED